MHTQMHDSQDMGTEIELLTTRCLLEKNDPTAKLILNRVCVIYSNRGRVHYHVRQRQARGHNRFSCKNGRFEAKTECMCPVRPSDKSASIEKPHYLVSLLASLCTRRRISLGKMRPTLSNRSGKRGTPRTK